MASIKIDSNNEILVETLSKIIGLHVVRFNIGYDLSLFIGFDKLNQQSYSFGVAEHAEWEIGTYNSSWRISENNQLISGIHDDIELSEAIKQIESRLLQRRIVGIKQLSDWDIRIDFDNNISIDVMAATKDDNEILHVFCPKSTIICFELENKWQIGRSNEPWKD